MSGGLRRAIASLVLACCATAGGVVARAAEPGGDSHAQLAAERREIEAAYAASQRDCMQRFLVTRCLDEARTTRREALASIHRREAARDDAERGRRASARLRDIETKQARQEQDRRERAADPPLPFEAASAVLRSPRPVSPAPAAPAVRHDDAAAEARARQAYGGRQRRIEEHREAAAEREARRAREGRAAAPPLPAASAP